MPDKKKDESLEQGLSHSATKKGLTGPAKREYIGGAITNMRKKGRLPARATGAKKAAPKAPAKPPAEPNHKEVYLARKRKERAEQDKKDYERIMEKREPAWALSGHDKAVIKREGARRDKEYKAKQAELEKARKEQKKQAQEEKHTALYSAGKKPMYVVYAAKYPSEKAQPVAEFKTQASASNHAYKLRQKGYAHTEYKNEYKGPEKPKEPTYDVTIIKHPGSLSGHARREVKDLTASEVQSLLNSTPTSIYKNFKVYKAGTGELVRSATGTKDDPYWKLSRKRG